MPEGEEVEVLLYDDEPAAFEAPVRAAAGAGPGGTAGSAARPRGGSGA
jgi:hypothetical protein